MSTILHIDGDYFFASCEISLNPKLRGKPVVTGQERGIATSMSPEAKALGVHRGMPVFKIKKEFPQVIITTSNYKNYGIFAQRMYDIVRRYSHLVEEYSIDECFADLSDPEGQLGPFRAMAESLKSTLNRELGMTFSIGIGPTKVLAKVASKHQKPDGLTIIEPEEIRAFLKDLHIGKVWGIGPQTSVQMQKLGINTALELIDRPEIYIKANFARPVLEIWHELQGHAVHRVHSEPEDDNKSIQQTRTFGPPTNKKEILLSEISKNLEGACAKVRRSGLTSKKIYYFLKTQEFRYHRCEIQLISPSNTPIELLNQIKRSFDTTYRTGFVYRATGVTLADLRPVDQAFQNDLFGEVVKNEKSEKVFEIVDMIDRRYGSHTMMLGSSINAQKRRGTKPERHFKIPYMGEVV